MLNVAAEICQLVHDIGSMETIGVKIASAEGSAVAQHTVARASTALYSVIDKSASDYVPPGMPHHQQMTTFIDKVAAVLGRPEVPREVRHKIASAVAADDALTDVMSQEKNPVEYTKLAEARAFGREFVMELLRGVL